MKVYIYVAADGQYGGDVHIGDVLSFDSLEKARAYGIAKVHLEDDNSEMPSWRAFPVSPLTAEKAWYLSGNTGKEVVMIREFEL